MAELTVYANYQRAEDQLDDVDWVEEDGVWSGAAFGYRMRAAFRFPLAALPPGSTVNSVSVSFYVNDTEDASGQYWLITGYNGNGQADPNADSWATYYPRAYDWGEDDEALYTPSGYTDFRSTGPTGTDLLGGEVVAHVTAAKAAVDRFTIGVCYAEGLELNGAAILARIDDETQARRPALIIDYTPPSGGEYNIGADDGEVEFSGSEATFSIFSPIRFDLEPGDVGVVGASATITRGYFSRLADGSVEFSGSEVTLTVRRSYHLNADTGAVEFAGSEVSLDVHTGYYIEADSGDVAFTGSDANFNIRGTVRISADPGAAAFAGGDAIFYVDTGSSNLVADAGIFSLNGKNITLYKKMALTGNFPKAAIVRAAISANPSSNLTSSELVIGQATFSFAETATPPYVVAYGANAREAVANLVEAINSVGAEDTDPVYFNARHADKGATTTASQTVILTSTIVGFEGGDFSTDLDVTETGSAITLTELQQFDANVPQYRDWIEDLLTSNQINAEVIAELLRPLGGALGSTKDFEGFGA